jgi:hypothetical protein
VHLFRVRGSELGNAISELGQVGVEYGAHVRGERRTNGP